MPFPAGRPSGSARGPNSHRSARVGLIVILLSALLSTAAGPSTSPEASAYLASRIDDHLDAPGADTAFWGVHVVDVATGRMVYSRNGDKRLIPASNLKLLTTAAALDALSSEHRYQTVLYMRGEIEGETLVGDLIIRGSGDPSFGSRRFREDPLRTWAKRLAEMGIRRIEGRIIGDDNAFDDQPYQEGWDVGLIGTRTYATGTGGLPYRDNIAHIVVRGGQAGAPVRVSQSPGRHLVIVNKAYAISRGRSGLRLVRTAGSNSVRLEGGVRAGHRQTIRIPVSDPTRYMLSAFESYLYAEDIVLEGTLEDIDDLRSRPGYRGAQPLFAHISPPLGTLIQLVNKNSNNFYAEQIFRTIGDRGDARSAERRIRNLAERAGASTSGLSVCDGSGLSRKDLVSPQLFAQVLAHMFTHEEWESFSASLPRGGERGSTLARRLTNVPVQAKTGSLEFARALSGYVYTKGNNVLAFSAIANNYSTSGGQISRTLDAIVRTLASYEDG